MQVDPNKIYMTPHIMGSLYDKDALPSVLYPQTETFPRVQQPCGWISRGA